jgi:2-hydroxychromene-2-carboxylate isomerase
MDTKPKSDVLEFYFDFSSPYGYFAAAKVDDLAAEGGRRAIWKPVLLGVLFKETGARPLTESPIKGTYVRRDWERLSQQMGVPWKMPTRFPIPTQAAARAFYWLDDRDTDLARLFAKTAYHAYFAEGKDISSPDTVADIVAAFHVDRTEIRAALDDPAVKERLRRENEEALKRGVFGSPFFIVDGEGFWGSDRMWMVKKWMKGVGW